jgi:hypothetical protein
VNNSVTVPSMEGWVRVRPHQMQDVESAGLSALQ